MRGFTMIEAMIVVAIIGIFAAAAIPACQDMSLKQCRETGDCTDEQKSQLRKRAALESEQEASGESQMPSGVRTMCVDGYKFVETNRGLTQVMAMNGMPETC